MGDAASSWRVRFFDGRDSFRAEWPGIADQVNRVFDNDKFAHGKLTVEFEEAIRRYTGARHAVGVNTGMDALYLILRAVGVGDGDEVVVPAYAPLSSVAVVRRAGATPQTAVSPRTKAVLGVHVFAPVPDVVGLRRIADEAGVPLVEDSTQAMGMRHNGVHAGLFGAAGALSFAPGNTLGALGDAGMVITDNAEIAERCMRLRHHGRTGEVPGHASDVSSSSAMAGMNSKMDEIQAAVLLARLGSLDTAIARRREVTAHYTKRLSGIAGVQVPFMPEDQVWSTFVMEAERRDDLVDYLIRAGVQTVVPALVNQERLLALPVYPDLKADDIDHVCDTVAQFYEGGQA